MQPGQRPTKGPSKPFKGVILPPQQPTELDPKVVAAIAQNLPEATPNPKYRPRPGAYTPQLAATVIAHIANGLTIDQIETLDGCPCWETIRKWLLTYPGFVAEYARAREVSADRLESEALQRVRNAKTPDEAQIARVLLDAVKWSTAKRAPKVYGEKLEHAGSIDVNIGLADRLEKARQRQIAAQAGAVIEGTIVNTNPANPVNTAASLLIQETDDGKDGDPPHSG